MVGPLAAFAEPHTYDLCEPHARSLTAPRGWDVVRHEGEFEPPPPTTDDLVALAEAVREAARPAPPRPPDNDHDLLQNPPTGRRGHLRVIPPPTDPTRGPAGRRVDHEVIAGTLGVAATAS